MLYQSSYNTIIDCTQAEEYEQTKRRYAYAQIKRNSQISTDFGITILMKRNIKIFFPLRIKTIY